MCEVRLNNIDFFYDDYHILENLSLELSSGNFLVMVGPNGAGKSTLLKIIAGLLTPRRGTVSIASQSVAGARQQGLIGYVPQSYGKNVVGFPATVEEIVALGLAAGQFTCHRKQAAKHIVEHMLELVGMANFRQRRIGELSGGQLQRVMVARALAGNPQILLLDEPTSGIDFEASAKIYQLLGSLNRNLGITVIMVSHDIDRATEWATQVACVNRGLCFIGPTTEFREKHGQNKHLWYYSGR